MPKRVIDGEGLWRSDKLARVEPPGFRAEYACLLPLALANGVFEANARRIWATVYSYNRPDVNVETVEKILAEFERVKLLFAWIDAGKTWGYFVGIEKPGRLPAPSRLKHSHEVLGPQVPGELLNIFLGSDVTSGQPTASHSVTNGSGGFGFCLGLGLGKGDGQPMASHEGESCESIATPTGELNSTSVAWALCCESGWSGLQLVDALKTAVEFKSREMPESSIEQVGEWLVKAFFDHEAEHGKFAGGPLSFFQQAKYPHSKRRPVGSTAPANDPAAYAMAQMEGD
jgi:hypothetical protein